MDTGLEWRDELRPDDYACIGGCVSAFGVLERVLGLLINSMPAHSVDRSVDKPESAMAQRHAAALGKTLGEQVKYLRQEGETLPEAARLSDAEFDQIETLAQIRNIVSHGVWRRIGNCLEVVWFDRPSITALRIDSVAEPARLSLTNAAWRDVAAGTIAIARVVREKLCHARLIG